MIDFSGIPTKNRICFLVGQSGSGKTTLGNNYIKHFSHPAGWIESITTREPRANDVPGSYRHVSPEEFQAMKFLWKTTAGEHRYGSLPEQFVQALQYYEVAFLGITPEIVQKLPEHFPDYRYVVARLETPPRAALQERMEQRGESAELIGKRMQDCGNWERLMNECLPKNVHIIKQDTPLRMTIQLRKILRQDFR